MTGQHPDEVRFEHKRFALTAVDGSGLFDPVQHGIEPRWLGTGCYHGFICHYSVVRRRLVLRQLVLGSDGEPAPIGGVRPVTSDYGWQYKKLTMPVAFTGRLLIGNDFVGPGVRMGFVPAWLFADVRELTFQDGFLHTAADRSAELAAVREVLDELGTGPDLDEDAGDWIARTFSLSYDYSWPGRERPDDQWHELSAAVLNRRSTPMPAVAAGDGPPDRKS